jgi:hypothetical protein
MMTQQLQVCTLGSAGHSSAVWWLNPTGLSVDAALDRVQTLCKLLNGDDTSGRPRAVRSPADLEFVIHYH